MPYTLSHRLRTILDMIPKYDTLCDVGCDHGYLPIEALKKGICLHAYALDVRKGPLDRAKENISREGLSDSVTIRLSDGLSAMRPSEAEVIVIAGMGGPLMERILTEGMAVIKEASLLVLAPQSHLYDFRCFLKSQNFGLKEERLIKDEGKYYHIMAVTLKGGNAMPGDDLSLRYGTVRSPVFSEYLAAEHDRLSSIREQLIKSGCDDERLHRIEEEIRIITSG